MRAQRPPTSASLGRAGTMVNNDPSAAKLDEEALRDEHARLSAMVDNLQREGAETRDRLKSAERDSLRKDKILQEMLAAATTAKGVPGEALDQIREEVQVMMNIKRKMHEARRVIEEKERKIKDMKEVLKSTSTKDMEEEVESAKKTAKAKAQQFAEMQDEDPNSDCCGLSRQLQADAKAQVDKLAKLDADTMKTLRELARLRSEQGKFKTAIDDHAQQLRELEVRSAEIERLSEHCRQSLASMGDVEATYQEHCEERERRALVRPAQTATQAPPAAEVGRVDLGICDDILTPTFRPLQPDCSPEASKLFWRFRQAVNCGQSGIEVLYAEDKNSDGRTSVEEFTRGLERLGVQGAGMSASQELAKALSPPLYSSSEQLVRVLDLILALPLQPPPSEQPSEQELAPVLQSMAWSCRRQGKSERELRSRIAGWLEDPKADLEAEATRCCRELGLPTGQATSGVLARSLETRREAFTSCMPSWRHLSAQSQASILVHYIHDVIIHKETVAPLLSAGPMHLQAFVDFSLHHLGSHWSTEDLEHVALLAECPGAAAGTPPTVDGPRLLRAAMQDGLSNEFPELQRQGHPDALRKCDAALKAAQRPSPHSARVSTSAPAGSMPSTGIAPTSLSAALGRLSTGSVTPNLNTNLTVPVASGSPAPSPSPPAADASAAGAQRQPAAQDVPSESQQGGNKPSQPATAADEDDDENYEDEEYEEDLEEDIDEDDGDD